MSLINFSNLQADTGDRTTALELITEAVGIYRQLVRTDAACLPDLAGSLNNLALLQADAGDRAAALASISSTASTVEEVPTTSHIPALRS
jgi:hypothetical protein